MATGDVLNPSRPRYEANERFDTVDADAASQAPLDHIDALIRAMLTTPRAAGGTSPVGLLLTGFSLTLNPTGPSDGLVRINAELGVAVDANGRPIIKPAGTTLDLTIPAGSHQLYVYYRETDGETAKRRFLTVTPPFTEYSQAMNTKYQSTLGTYVRSGNNTNIVPDDVVNGVTTPLVCIGICTNTAGAISMTGYDATTAPNGSDITNRMATVTAPATPPTVNTRNGSPKTLHDLLTAALYSIGQVAWKGSDFLTPAAGNNFGAYSIPAGGVDKAFRQALGHVTIGNGLTVFGDFNQTDYANDKLLLDAALAALPAQGGTIHLKRGVALTNFANALSVLPAGKTVTIQGDHTKTPATVPQLSFASLTEGLVCSTTGTLILRDLHIRATHAAVIMNTGPVLAENCYFEKPSGPYGGAIFNANGGTALVQDVTIRDCEYDGTFTANALAASFFLANGIARRISIKNVKLRYNGTAGVTQAITILDMRENVVLEDIHIRLTADSVAGAGGINCVELNTTDNTTEIQGRLIRNLVVRGKLTNNGANEQWRALSINNVGYLTIEDFVSDYCNVGLHSAAAASPGRVRVVRAHIRSANDFNVFIGGEVVDFSFEDCVFDQGTWEIGDGTANVQRLVIKNCHFIDCRPDVDGNDLLGVTFEGNTVRRSALSSLNGANFEGAGDIVENISVRRNRFLKLGNATTPNVYTTRVLGNIVRNVVYDGNEIEDFQNVVYSGGDALTSPRLLEIDADVIDKGAIIVSNNCARNVMQIASGNARRGVYLVEVNSEDRATPSIFAMPKIQVIGNQVGNDNSCVMLLKTRNVYPTHVVINNNMLWSAWKTGATDTKMDDVVDIVIPSSLVSINAFMFNGNEIHYENFPGSDLNEDLIFLSDGGSGGQIDAFTFNNNLIFQSGASFKWNFVTAWGINCDRNITNLMVIGNQASRPTSASTAHFETRFTGSVTRTNHTGGALPGAGVAWINNNLIHGG